MCSVLLRQQVSLADASCTSSLGIPLRIPAATHAYNTIRGGGSDATEPEEEEELDVEEEQGQEQEQSRKKWPVDNLFRLNDDVKFDAASVVTMEEKKELNDPPLEQPISKTSKKEGSGNNSRGGALTMVKAPKPKSRRFAWLAPLDTSRVAPSSSRLLQDEEDQLEQEPDVAVATATAASATASENATAADTNNTASAEMTSFNQIWWGNVWDQQLPDADEQIEVESANDLPESPTVQEPELKRASGRKTKRKASREVSTADAKYKQDADVSREASAADAKSKQDTEALPTVDQNTIQSYNDNRSIAENTTRMERETQEEAQLRPAFTLTAQPIHTSNTTQSSAGDTSPSPFVSSGYVSDEHRDFLAPIPFVVACTVSMHPCVLPFFIFYICTCSGIPLIR
jgi:hypothetical protein